MIVKIACLTVFSVKPEQRRQACHRRVVCRHRTTISQAAERFEWIKTETSSSSERSCSLTFKLGPECLGCIFNDCQVVLSCDGHDSVHFAYPTIQMHRNNSFRSQRNCGFECCRIHVVVFTNLDQYGLGSGMHNSGNGSHKCVSHRNYLIPGARSHSE